MTDDPTLAALVATALGWGVFILWGWLAALVVTITILVVWAGTR